MEQSEQNSANRTNTLIATAVAAAAILFWTLFVRSSTNNVPFSFENWVDFDLFNPYFLGFALQEILIPLALVYGFSRTALFRRIVSETAVPPDEWRLMGALLGIQLLVFLIRLGLARTTDDQVTFDLLIVLVAGLLGGWRAGLVAGLLATMLTGLSDYLFWDEDPFSLARYFEFAVLKNLDAVTAVWVGTTIGLTTPLLQEQRFRPPITAGLAVGLVAIAFALMLYPTGYPPFYLNRLLPNLLIYGLALAAVALMVQNVRDEASRRLAETAQLELAQANLNLTQTRLALTQAELRALHAQINPHFFFNTLNTIRYFVRTNPDEARELLIKLSEIFQRALSAGEFVPLQDEISYVEAYLALEKARLDERLNVIWTNLAKEWLDTAVPTLVLQPLVENAVIHGVSQQPEGGTIHIVINRVADDLLIQLDDDGPGFDVAKAMANGATQPNPLPEVVRPSIGLRNVDERLRMLYGDSYRLHIDSEPGKGTRIVFKVPLEKETGD
ncbi:sensor histidine kinase [Candidatus Leptofilum sp.]|uniref:sensor histidine kinase n=1 Tax=Candidatus Leptofilum sp. TaxID=3241576 RepID=UPI003B5B9C84